MRRARADWDELVVGFKTSDAERIHPLRASLKQVTRETVLVIDRLLDQKGWSRVDQSALKDIARHTAEALLYANPDDAEIRAIFERHGSMSFEEARREEIEDLKQHAKEHMGIDLGDADIESEEDLIQRVYEHMKNDEARQQARSSERRKSRAQQQAETNAQTAKRYLREIYRKLVSAVHPDREADVTRRAEKNDLMQQINRAYATNDLLTLLEAQRRLDLIEPDHASQLGSERLQHFNRLLAQQLEAAKAELRSLQDAFCTDHDLPPGRKVDPRALHLLTQHRARELRAQINQQKRFLEVLASKTSTKRWLKEQRRFGIDFDED
ncbi:MAG: J domain-containing protein [Pseudomonadota bacterium]|nr:J domain-containing protein [Pseudomonadota bacterium]